VDCAISTHGDDNVTAFFSGLLGKFDGVRGVDGSAPGEFAFEFLRDGTKVVGVWLRMSLTLCGMEKLLSLDL
jgi:hypothetical protein